MRKKQIPECPVVPGLLTGIDYAELIKRDSSNVNGIVESPKKERVKEKVYSKQNKVKRR